MEEEFEDIQLQEILLKGRKEIPFPDFENEIMVEIHKEHDRKRSILKNIKLSWFFFIIGMISGITLVSILPLIYESTEEASSNIFLLSILIIAICMIILLFAEKLIKFSFFKK
jgi:hypothetical protein